MQFLASPWKLWESGQITLRRMVLKLAFIDRITYYRNQGARTTKIALPFKALGGHLYRESKNGADEKTRTSTGVTPQRPQRCASTNSATSALYVAVFSTGFWGCEALFARQTQLLELSVFHRAAARISLKSDTISDRFSPLCPVNTNSCPRWSCAAISSQLWASAKSPLPSYPIPKAM